MLNFAEQTGSGAVIVVWSHPAAKMRMRSLPLVITIVVVETTNHLGGGVWGFVAPTGGHQRFFYQSNHHSHHSFRPDVSWAAADFPIQTHNNRCDNNDDTPFLQPDGTDSTSTTNQQQYRLDPWAQKEKHRGPVMIPCLTPDGMEKQYVLTEKKRIR
eukprot:scaffold24278_cov178-Amphora_coffeaeformis.AAC.4